uniref:Uncharacterized protein n=1 Tax=Rhizophora mucronata TaxID=61149 RepID=A0A2P2KI17_RHIMU
MAAALASRPEVGSSMNIIEGFATSSTAIVSLFLCSVESPVVPGSPTIAFLRLSSSTSSMTSSTKSILSSSQTSLGSLRKAENINDSPTVT